MYQTCYKVLVYSFFLSVLISLNILVASERILEYKSYIQVEVDGTLQITEDITVFSKGHQIKRGIFRDFPIRYKDKYGNTINAGFQIQEVLRNDLPEPYTIQNISNGKKIRVGDQNIFIPSGKHTYTLKYTTNRQIGFFENFLVDLLLDITLKISVLSFFFGFSFNIVEIRPSLMVKSFTDSLFGS